MTVPFQRPRPPAAEALMAYYRRSEEAGYYTDRGPCVSMLAGRVEAMSGAYVVPAPSGTLGLMLALRALAAQNGPGDRVAMVSFTCAAVACAVDWAGLRPLWVDVDPHAWQLDADYLERALAAQRGRVVAVIGTATFGAPPAPAVRDRWVRACAAEGVPLIVDAAAAAGAAGWLELGGDVSLVSFGTTKPGGVAEGALLLARDEALAARIAGLARFGIGAGQVGLNGHVSELHAAAMLAALDELDGTIARRRAVAQALRADVGALGARLQGGADGSAWQFLNVALPSAAARAAAREAAADRDVATRTLWAPLHHEPAFAAGDAPAGLCVTEELAERSLSLPVLVDMTPDEHAALVGVVAAGMRVSAEG